MYKIIKPEKLNENVIKLVSIDWMLVTAGNLINYNCMTASWGGLGHIWNKPVSFVFIRPPRHTYKFVENNEFFTLSFFEEKYREILNICGTKSGRDINKMKDTGLIPFKSKNNSVYFEEARILIECRKLYFQDIEPKNFIDKNIIKHYPNLDFHRMYVAEITEVLVKQRR